MQPRTEAGLEEGEATTRTEAELEEGEATTSNSNSNAAPPKEPPLSAQIILKKLIQVPSLPHATHDDYLLGNETEGKAATKVGTLTEKDYKKMDLYYTRSTIVLLNQRLSYLEKVRLSQPVAEVNNESGKMGDEKVVKKSHTPKTMFHQELKRQLVGLRRHIKDLNKHSKHKPHKADASEAEMSMINEHQKLSIFFNEMQRILRQTLIKSVKGARPDDFWSDMRTTVHGDTPVGLLAVLALGSAERRTRRATIVMPDPIHKLRCCWAANSLFTDTGKVKDIITEICRLATLRYALPPASACT